MDNVSRRGRGITTTLSRREGETTGGSFDRATTPFSEDDGLADLPGDVHFSIVLPESVVPRHADPGGAQRRPHLLGRHVFADTRCRPAAARSRLCVAAIRLRRLSGASPRRARPQTRSVGAARASPAPGARADQGGYGLTATSLPARTRTSRIRPRLTERSSEGPADPGLEVTGQAFISRSGTGTGPSA